MKVKLEAKRNPDFSEDHTSIKAKWITVSSLIEASSVCREFIDTNELGSGNWTGGNVIDDTGKPLAYISYNGRIWEQKCAS